MRKLGEILGWVVPSLFLALIVGCGPSNRGAVSGQVSLNGQPVDGGLISFIPTGRDTSLSACSEIKAGRYAIPAASGPGLGVNRVEIHWLRKTGRKVRAVPPAAETDELAEAIPARYNSQSELKAEIKPGNNPVDFDLRM